MFSHYLGNQPAMAKCIFTDLKRPAPRQWSQMANLLCPKKFGGDLVGYEGKLYLMAGACDCDSGKNKYRNDGLIQLLRPYHNRLAFSIDSYDIAAGTWSVVSQMPNTGLFRLPTYRVCFQFFTLIVLSAFIRPRVLVDGTDVFVMGGNTCSGQRSSKVYLYVSKYKPTLRLLQLLLSA